MRSGMGVTKPISPFYDIPIFLTDQIHIEQCYITFEFGSMYPSWAVVTLAGKYECDAVNYTYHETSSIRHRTQALNVSCIVLQLSLPNTLKPGDKSRRKM